MSLNHTVFQDWGGRAREIWTIVYPAAVNPFFWVGIENWKLTVYGKHELTIHIQIAHSFSVITHEICWLPCRYLHVFRRIQALKLDFILSTADCSIKPLQHEVSFSSNMWKNKRKRKQSLEWTETEISLVQGLIVWAYLIHLYCNDKERTTTKKSVCNVDKSHSPVTNIPYLPPKALHA